MFILNGSATLSVPAIGQASHLSSPAALLGTAPASEATGSWFRDSFVGKALYNPQTSTIQKLQGSNALLSFVIGIFTGTLTNPLTLLSIGLGGAAFLLGITNPGLILACAAVGALQALGSAKDTLHSVKENGLFSLSTLMSAGGTALSAFCVMPGIGNLGNALKIAKLKSFTAVKGAAVEAKDLGSAILNTEKKIAENLTTLKESLTKGKDALKTVESKIVDIAKVQGHTATEVNKQLLKDLEKQLAKKIETASEEAKKEFQKALKDLRKLASERRKILVANNYGNKLRIKFEGIDGEGGILKSLKDLKANQPGALETFNNHLNYTLETSYDRYARAFIRETYGAQGSRGYDQIKGIVGKGKAKYTNWKGDVSKSQIVDTPPKPPAVAPVTVPSAPQPPAPQPPALTPSSVLPKPVTVDRNGIPILDSKSPSRVRLTRNQKTKPRLSVAAPPASVPPPSPPSPAFAPPPPPAYHEFRAPQPSTKPKTPLRGGIGASPPQPLISPEIAKRFPPEGQYILKVNRQGVNGNYIWNTTTGKYDFVADLPIPNPSMINKIINFLSGLGTNHPVRTMV